MFDVIKRRVKEMGRNIVCEGISQWYKNTADICEKNDLGNVQQKNEYADVKNVPILAGKYTPKIATNEKRNYWKERYGLEDYHINVFNDFTSCVDLVGKTVLEIGGCNMPKELVLKECGVKKWVCVDKPVIYNDVARQSHFNHIPLFQFAKQTLDEALKKDDYIIFNEYAEFIPDIFFDKFDIVFSNSAFEHIKQLPVVLDIIFSCLKENGFMYSQVGPLWSCSAGHHVGIRINDNQRLRHNDWPPELNHCHLCMSYRDIYKYLEENYGTTPAKKHTNHIKNSDDYNSLNKLFYEDYVFLMHHSLFKEKTIYPFYYCDVEDDKIKLLQNMYPGYHRFDVGGIIMQGIKNGK